MKKADLNKLKAALLAAGATGMLVKQADAQELVTLGFAEINTTVAPDADGKVPTRATAALTTDATAPAASTEKPKFVIMDNIMPVAGTRGGVREEVYPFSQLGVNQSFVVEAVGEETGKQVVERFSSTVSSATRRFSVPDPTGKTRTNKRGVVVAINVPTKKFTLRPVTKGDATSVAGFVEPATGARVFRTA